MADAAETVDKTLKVPVATHLKINRLCRALEILDFADERAYKRVSAGDAIERLLEQDWAKETLAKAKDPTRSKL